MNIKIYSTNACPNCRALKELLKKNRLEFTEVDMATPEALTGLSMDGIFTTRAPILQVDGTYYTKIFKDAGLDVETVKKVLHLQ